MARGVSWWRSGLLGSFVLLASTGVKFLQVLVVGAMPEFGWSDAATFVAGIFTLGFACGLVGRAGLGLSRRFGPVGDAMVGVAVTTVFFLGCMLAFTPEMLGPKWTSGGLPMFGLAVLIGLVCGPWFGRDLRREIGS